MITIKKPIAKLHKSETRLGLEVKRRKVKKSKSLEDWSSKKFFFLKDAQSFQRKKRKEGFKTKQNKINNASEHHVIYWCKK